MGPVGGEEGRKGVWTDLADGFLLQLDAAVHVVAVLLVAVEGVDQDTVT